MFIFVTEGMIQVIEEGTEYRVGEKEHLFLKKGLHHWGLQQMLPRTSWFWIHFNSLTDERIVYKNHARLPELNFFFPDDYQYRFLLPKYGSSTMHQSLGSRISVILESSHTRNQHVITLVSMLVYQLFLELNRVITAHPTANSGGKAAATAGRVMSYLMQHAEEEFDSKQLSQYLNMNYSYLSATFKKITGQSIIETHTKL